MPDTPRTLPPKKEVALALLEGESVFIHLDPRKEGVLVPKNLGKQPQLVLQIGLNLAIRIPDLSIDDDGVSCSLSFNRASFWCRMPWTAIYALVGPDGRGMLWPEDVPPEVATQMRAGRGAARTPAAKKPRPRLAAVAREAEAADEAADETRAGAGADAPSREAASRSKRPSARPALAGVPSLSSLPSASARKDTPRREHPARAPLGAHHPPPSRPSSPGPGGAPTAGNRPSDPGRAASGTPKKPKRELPPYLRVVK